MPAWARELLRDGRVGHLATADAGARPLALPVCYAVIESAAGEPLRLVTAVDGKPKSGRRLRRLRNLEQNPRAALVVDRYDEDWSRLCWVLAEGSVRLLGQETTGPAAAEHRCALGALGRKYAQYSALPLDQGRTTVIAIEVERLRWWRFA